MVCHEPGSNWTDNQYSIIWERAAYIQCSRPEHARDDHVWHSHAIRLKECDEYKHNLSAQIDAMGKSTIHCTKRKHIFTVEILFWCTRIQDDAIKSGNSKYTKWNHASVASMLGCDCYFINFNEIMSLKFNCNLHVLCLHSRPVKMICKNVCCQTATHASIPGCTFDMSRSSAIGAQWCLIK